MRFQTNESSCMSRRLIEVSPGDRFSSWVVLKELESSCYSSRLFLCRCDCGIEKPVGLKNLLGGTSRACFSCANKSRRGLKQKSSWIDPVVGDRFDRWTVLSYLENNRHNQRMVMCRCDCGVEKAVALYTLISGRSRSCADCLTKETRRGRLSKQKQKGGLNEQNPS